jgi:hypothetical protein
MGAAVSQAGGSEELTSSEAKALCTYPAGLKERNVRVRQLSGNAMARFLVFPTKGAQHEVG